MYKVEEYDPKTFDGVSYQVTKITRFERWSDLLSAIANKQLSGFGQVYKGDERLVGLDWIPEIAIRKNVPITKIRLYQIEQSF